MWLAAWPSTRNIVDIAAGAARRRHGQGLSVARLASHISCQNTNFPLNSDLRHRLRRRRFLSLVTDALRRDMRHDRKLGLAPRLLHAGYSRRNVRDANSAVIGTSKLRVLGYKIGSDGFHYWAVLEPLRALRPGIDPRLNQFAEHRL